MVTQKRLLLLGGERWYNIFGGMLKTGQTTVYHVGDDGDYEAGLTASHTVMDTGAQSGTTAVDVPHYAAATLTFAAADKSITDSANGLVTLLDGDTIRIRGSVANDGVYTIASGGGTAGHFHVTEALVNEAAGAYITNCKRATRSNILVQDNVTGLMWPQNTTGTIGSAEKVGPASDGKLNWYNAATCFTLHPAVADLRIVAASKTLRIVGGAAQLPRYFVGMIIVLSGMANTPNMLPGYRVDAIAVNGADLDLTLWTGPTVVNPLVSEAPAGSQVIKIICQSVYAYIAACNAVSYAGYADWRLPSPPEFWSLCDLEAATAAPDSTAFPNWPVSARLWATTSRPAATGSAMDVEYTNGVVGSSSNTAKTNSHFLGFVRGG